MYTVVSNRPSPYIRAAASTTVVLHKLGYLQILRAVIPTDAARPPVLLDSFKEREGDGMTAVVVAHTEGDDEAALAVDETVHNNLVANESWWKSRVRLCRGKQGRWMALTMLAIVVPK